MSFTKRIKIKGEKIMTTTVKEVIEELKKYPDDMRIVTLCISKNYDGVWRDFDGFAKGLLNLNEQRPFGLYTGYENKKEHIDEIKNNFYLENPKFEEVIVFESRV